MHLCGVLLALNTTCALKSHAPAIAGAQRPIVITKMVEPAIGDSIYAGAIPRGLKTPADPQRWAYVD